MSKAVLVAALAGLLMLVSAVLLLALGRRIDERQAVVRRLNTEVERRGADGRGNGGVPLRRLYQMLQRAGLARRPLHLLIAAAAVAALGAVAFLLKGLWGLLTEVAGLAVALYGFLAWRAAATRERLREQLPGFIDQIIRLMGIGRSFDNALLQAIGDSPQPLADALEGVRVESSLGGDVVDALKGAARLYRMKELQLLTLALHINRRYGGSIKAMLESIIAMIRRREQADRELRALTGETRLSAWVLGAIPLLMAGYMMLTNPSYLGHLLDHPQGNAIIATALGLQGAGGLLLWRMMRSLR